MQDAMSDQLLKGNVAIAEAAVRGEIHALKDKEVHCDVPGNCLLDW